jgi:hypothetical protein
MIFDINVQPSKEGRLFFPFESILKQNALYLVHQAVIQCIEESTPMIHQLPSPMQIMVFAIIVIGL